MKYLGCFFTIIIVYCFVGCGPEGSSSSTNVSLDSSSSTSTSSSSDSSSNYVYLERGPVLYSTVTDANGQTATFEEVTNSSGEVSYQYVFASTPTYPVSASGGYIDVNYDNVIDSNDMKLDVNLSSYTQYVSPITTYIGADTSRLSYFMSYFGLTEDQLMYSLPTDTSDKYSVILSNALYYSLKNNYSYGSSDFDNSITEQINVYNTSYSSITDLESLNANMENNIISTNNYSKLTSSEASAITSQIIEDNNISLLTISNSSTSSTKSTSDSVTDIWDFTFEVSGISSSDDFNIGISISKQDSTVTANIVYENVAISGGTVSLPDNIHMYGEKTEGSSKSTSSRTYSYTNSDDQTLIKGSIEYIQKYLSLNIGHIIDKQNIVESSRFTASGVYTLEIYIENISIDNAENLSATKSLNTSFSDTISFDTSSKHFTYTITIN